MATLICTVYIHQDPLFTHIVTPLWFLAVEYQSKVDHPWRKGHDVRKLSGSQSTKILHLRLRILYEPVLVASARL